LYLRRGGTAIGVAHTPETTVVVQEDVYLVNEGFAPYYESRVVVDGVSSGMLNTYSDGARVVGWNLGVNQLNAYRMTGLIGECVVFQGEVSQSANLDTREVYNCRKYLANKWGTTLQQDVHKIVVWEGNSLIFGLFNTDPATDCPPAQLQGLLGTAWDPWGVYGCGQSGSVWTDLEAQFVIQVNSRFRAGAARNVLLVYEDTNTINGEGLSTSQVMAQKAAYCRRARAAGFEVWAATCIKFATGVPAKETTRQEVNAATRSTWDTFADGLVDFAARPTLLDNTNETYFYTDHTHLTTAGSAEMAAEAYAMLTA